MRRAKNERRWIYKRNTRSGLYHEVRHNYNFGESRGRSQVADECSIVEKGSAWHNAAGWKTMEGTRWDQERGTRGRERRGRFGGGKRAPMMGVKRSAKERTAESTHRVFLFVAAFRLEGPFVSLPNVGEDAGPRSPDGAHMANQPGGRSRLFGTKYARCAQLWSLNYLVRVSLFIEYIVPVYFSGELACRGKRETGVLRGRTESRTAVPLCEFRHFAERGGLYILFGLTSKPEVVGIRGCVKIRTADFRVLQKTRRIQNKQAYYTRDTLIRSDCIPLHY